MPPPIIDDPYAVLGIPPDSSETDVKKAYRKLALQYHPDRQTGKSDEEIAEASEIFVKIAEAQEILTDPVKKYDWEMKKESQKSANAAAGGGANRGKGSVRSPHRPSGGSVRARSPMNRQGSGHSMRQRPQPRGMNMKQGSVRVGNRPVSNVKPKRVQSAGPLSAPRAPGAGGPRPSAALNPNRPGAAPPSAANRSKTAQMLRTPSSASVVSRSNASAAPKKPKIKPLQTVPQGETEMTFVRNNGKNTPTTTPTSEDAGAEPTKTKKKKKKKQDEEGQDITFVRNSSPNPGTKVKKPKNGDSASVVKKKKVKPTAMLSPQQAPRKSILGFNRTSIMSPGSTKGKKKGVGIKSFLGRAPSDKD